jgi:O-antigen ligase
MPATSLRYDSTTNYSPVVMAVAMLALALGCGYVLAVGELTGLYVALSLICVVAVLFDFRAGAVLLVLMLPMSASALFPHSMMGITGLNPLNLLLLATVGSYVLHGRLQRAGPVLDKPLVWLYIVPIAFAGVVGMRHVSEIPAVFYEIDALTYATARQYLLATVVKPMVIVAIAMMAGAAAARSQKPERFILPIAASVWLIGLIHIGFVISQGPSLATLASADERGFYTPLGMHANDLGRLHLFAFALLLFVWAESKRPGMRLFLLLTLVVLSTALVLTFSRAAIAGAILVGALFVTWKFNARTLSLAVIAIVLVVLLGADVIYSRMTLGFDEGANAVTAGRIQGLWLPLLPEVLKSPLWGSGLDSIKWSYPMQIEALRPTSHPHNAYLQTLLDMGIIGLALLLAYYAKVWKGFRALGSNAWLTPEMRGLFQGATAALLAFFATGLVGSSLRPEAESAYLWLAIGLLYGVRGRRPAS